MRREGRQGYEERMKNDGGEGEGGEVRGERRKKRGRGKDRLMGGEGKRENGGREKTGR